MSLLLDFLLIDNRYISINNFVNAKYQITITVSILAIFLATYQLWFQIYRNRYPINFLRDKIKIEFDFAAYNCIISILTGLVIVNTDLSITSSIYFLHVIYIVTLLAKYLFSYKWFIDDKYILDKYKNQVSIELKNGEIDQKNIESILGKLNAYCEQSFIKGEIVVSKYILNILLVFNKTFMEEKTKLLTENKISKEEIIDIEVKLYRSILRLIKLSNDYNKKIFQTNVLIK